jgi:hypothetical protein
MITIQIRNSTRIKLIYIGIMSGDFMENLINPTIHFYFYHLINISFTAKQKRKPKTRA